MTPNDLQNEKPFSYQTTKNGLVRISYKGKAVANLTGKEAVKFLASVECDSEKQIQLVMAKATGHFKHGNEKKT